MRVDVWKRGRKEEHMTDQFFSSEVSKSLVELCSLFFIHDVLSSLITQNQLRPEWPLTALLQIHLQTGQTQAAQAHRHGQTPGHRHICKKALINIFIALSVYPNILSGTKNTQNSPHSFSCKKSHFFSLG